jgi:membrane-associated phospholipid phosphatase
MTSNKEMNTRRWQRWAVKSRRYRPVIWLTFLMVSLFLFWMFLPAFYRASLWHSFQSQALVAGMIVLFSLLTVSLLWSAGQKVDDVGFAFLNTRGIRPRWLDWIMLGATQLGNGLTAFFLSLYFFFNGSRRLAYELMLGILSLWLIVELIKALVQRPRPAFNLNQVRMVGYRDRGRSFPSGHTSQVFFIATLLSHRLAVGWETVLLIYLAALFVGLTRLYVGAHYPRDVLAGAILGSAWGLVLGVI